MPDSPNLILFFGRLHPLLVHLPIGFLAILAVLEGANRIHHFKGAAQARGIVLLLTVIASIVAVICGLMLASAGDYDPNLLFWHKWMGIALALACAITAAGFWGKKHRLYVSFLMITLLLLGPASHYGGSMVHGRSYLVEYAPQWIRTLTGNTDTTPVVARKKITDPAKALVFADVVQPMLEQNCISCHGPEKVQGQLRLDTVEAIHKGGATGPSLVASNSQSSPLFKRLTLPPEDPKHMPPAGRPQLTDDQLTLIQWWIDSGASFDKTLVDLDAPPTIHDAVAALAGIPRETPPPPVPLDPLQPQISALVEKLKVVVDRVGPDQPWITCNAAMSRTFGDAELAQLAPLRLNITSLNLAGSKITDAGLASVGEMPNLQRLRLERTQITDAGLRHLQKLRKLEYLNLYDTAVTDASLKTLQSLPTLQQLYLWRTKVAPETAKAFATAKANDARIKRWQQQITLLERQIQSASTEVFLGISPATAPTTVPTTMAATAPSTAPTTVATTAPATAPTSAPAKEIAKAPSPAPAAAGAAPAAPPPAQPDKPTTPNPAPAAAAAAAAPPPQPPAEPKKPTAPQ